MKEMEATITELRKALEKVQGRYNKLHDEVKQDINNIDTKIIIETVKRENDMKILQMEFEHIEKQMEGNTTQIIERNNAVEMNMPTYSGHEKDKHSKTFLKNLNTYFDYKKVKNEDKMIVIENSLKNKAVDWFSMIKDAALNEETFKDLFLHHFFSERKQ